MILLFRMFGVCGFGFYGFPCFSFLGFVVCSFAITWVFIYVPVADGFDVWFLCLYNAECGLGSLG